MHLPLSHTSDMADPSKFTRQMRLESRSQAPLKKALVKRHSTFHALRVVTTPSTPTSPVWRAKTSRTKSQPRLSISAGAAVDVDNDDIDDDCFDDQEMTVSELECSVTALEVVQLQLDKQSGCDFVGVRVCVFSTWQEPL